METGHAGMTGQFAAGAAWTGQRGAFTDDPWGRTGPSPAACDACALSGRAHASPGRVWPEAFVGFRRRRCTRASVGDHARLLGVDVEAVSVRKAYQHCSSGGCEPQEVAVQHSLSSSRSHDCQYRVGCRDGEIR
jgi:hypothetical protein